MTGPAAVVARWWASVRPHRQDLRADALAGLTGAVASVPDGMASSVLAGVNPVYGLHASMAAPWAGGLATSTRLMVITTTGAAALAAGSALEDVDPSERPGALFLLALLAGVLMLVAGVLHLGRYTRFVSHSVMTGFLMGVAINIVAGQIPDLTGAAADGRVALAKAFDVVTHPGRIDPATLATGLGALALLWVAGRVRRLEQVGSLLALAVPTAVVLVTGASVARVDDAGPIPGGLPLPALPEPDHFTVGLVTAALSIAAIVLVQGVGVAEAAPNGDGRGADVDRDFVAQGVANVASGLWQGLPVGGSVGQTAINASAGARSRWAAVLSGVWMLVILVAFSGAVGRVALPTLAAVLIYAGIGSLRFGEVEVIWRTGPVSQVALATTLLATLLLPVTAAVGIGVALSLLLQINQEAVDLTVVRLVPVGDGRTPGAAAARRGHGARRLRQPLLRWQPHPAGPAAARAGVGGAGRGAAAAGPDRRGGDVLPGHGRLRPAIAHRRRPPLSERCGSRPGGADPAGGPGRRRGARPGVPGAGHHRRFDRRRRDGGRDLAGHAPPRGGRRRRRLITRRVRTRSTSRRAR